MEIGLPDKVIQKTNRELLELHKEVIKSYLTQKNVRHKYIKKFLKIYDFYITPDNIRRYFYRPIGIFVKAIILNRLEAIEDYVPINERKICTKKKQKR